VAKPGPGSSSPEDYTDTMAAGNGEPLTVRGALQTITKLEGLEVGLFRRTEGTTNIFWGLVIAGLFFAYFSMGAMFPDEARYWGPLLWIPWIGVGVLVTSVLWRTTHVAAKSNVGPKEGMKDGLIYAGVFFVIMFLGFMLFGLLLADETLRLREPGFMMGLMSIAGIIVALLIGNRATSTARKGHVVVGMLGLAATVVLAFASPAEEGLAYFVQTVVGALVLGGGWISTGLVLSLKG
jgi:FtsH-binding integral membrane protein